MYGSPASNCPNISLRILTGDLYIATNIDSAVWKVDMTTGELSFVLSDSYAHHDYEVCTALHCSRRKRMRMHALTPLTHLLTQSLTHSLTHPSPAVLYTATPDHAVQILTITFILTL